MSRAKRLFDICATVPGIIVLAIPLALVALLIKLDDGGPVFFRHERVGHRGRPFLLWKLRTMRTGAEKAGPGVTVDGDDRITRLGRWLRAYKLDELPQLINVLRGDMSLVGPRPEIASVVALYSAQQRAILDIMPGITDPASLKYRNEAALLARYEDPLTAYLEEVVPDKVRISIEYAQKATLWSDVGVLFRTTLPLSG